MPFRRILHARYVFPVVGDPIENGFVSIEAGRIVEVGKKPPKGDLIELGNAAILPGLINAHTHLEFSGLRQPLGMPGMGFVDWIREVTEWRRNHRIDPIATVTAGLQECLENGITSLGNITQIEESENVFENSSTEGTGFIELIAPTRDRSIRVIDYLQKDFLKRQTAVKIADSWRFGLSPHAPYSIHSDLLQYVVDLSSLHSLPLAMHLAESREEMQLLREGTGPFRDFLEELNVFESVIFPGGKRPLDYLKMLADASHTLIVHGNYLDDEEIDFLARHAANMAVIYCPRTHAFFQHDPYPLERMLAAGATVALGTDSRASSPDLSLLSEMRFVAKQYPQIGREHILKLGTIAAARALGRLEDIGSLETGKLANLAIVALPEINADDPYRLLLESETPLLQTWFCGQPVG
jgi:aminodeoxyfutalosine deaminase